MAQDKYFNSKYTAAQIESFLDDLNAKNYVPVIDPVTKHWKVNDVDTGILAEGANGSNGTDGASGESAYDIAVENGFEGTEEQWLQSLHGQDGINGTNGSNGTNGVDLAHTYSSNETEIGTWIDGRTMYQKVISMGELSQVEANAMAHEIQDIDLTSPVFITASIYDGTKAVTNIDFEVTNTDVTCKAVSETCYATVILQYMKVAQQQEEQQEEQNEP